MRLDFDITVLIHLSGLHLPRKFQSEENPKKNFDIYPDK